MKKVFLVLVFFAALLISAYGVARMPGDAPTPAQSQRASTESERSVRLAEGEVRAFIADTPELRRQGLSGSDGLTDRGRDAIYLENDDLHGFWMKDMKYPIDIIWLDANKRVVHIEASLDPSTYPTSYAPREPARYVLEVKAGWAERFNVQLGDVAQF